jgi:hypothetical protein
MDLKQLNKLLTEIQSLHNTKLELNKELQSGQLQMEDLIKKREAINSHLKESDIRKSANELILRAAKLFFSSKPICPSAADPQIRSPSTSPRRLESPKKSVKPFVSSPKKKKDILDHRSQSRRLIHQSESANELIDIKKEAENLLHSYYMKYTQ